MIVYGGIDENNRYLDDVWEFSFISLSWRKCEIRLSPEMKDNYGIAFHTMIAVYDYLDLFNT